MPYPLREFAYWMTRYRHTWRASAVFSLLNPLFFLAGIGAGLGRLVDAGGRSVDGVPYATYVAPGLLAASAMQTAFTESAQGVFAALRTKRSYRIAAASPLEPGDILAGHMLYVFFRVASTSVVFVAVGVALGVITSAGALWAVAAAALTGMAFALPAAAWAVVVRRSASLTLFFRFVIFPLYMFSGTFFDLATLPRWLQDAAYATPLSHGVSLCRDLALGQPPSTAMALDLAYLGALLCAGAVVARITYRRALHDH
jgi:lipooligosaccharide transport system permease protein